jgi:hypothetical protein
VAGLAAAQRRLGTPVTAGLDLAHADPANAVALARALVAALPAGGLSALEVGNEPDRYTRRRMSPRREGAAALAALRTSYDPARYAADVAAYAAALSPLVPGRVRLAVGGFAGTAWDAALPALLRRHRGLVGEVTAHAYALRGCHGRRPAAVLRSRLLSGAVSRRLVAQVAPALRAARGAGLPLQVTELNSASCGGIRGVSDAFASALWAPGALFALATAGVRGVDVHTWAGAAYAPFAVRHGPGVPRVEARPLFYGLLLFALATPYPSRLLPVQATGDVRAWATADGRAARVVAVNGARRRRRLRIAVRGARGAAGMLLRLRAPGPGARGHVTLGGRAIGAGGHPDAPWRPTRVTARRGWYAVSLPAASAVLLTVPVREPGASSPGRAGGVAAGGRW